MDKSGVRIPTLDYASARRILDQYAGKFYTASAADSG